MKNTWTAASIDDLKALLVLPYDCYHIHIWWRKNFIDGCRHIKFANNWIKEEQNAHINNNKMDSYKWMKCQLPFECEWCNAERDANLIIGKMGCEFLNICRNTYGPKWWWKLNWMFAVWNSVTSTDFTKQCGRWVNLTTWYGIQCACSSSFFSNAFYQSYYDCHCQFHFYLSTNFKFNPWTSEWISIISILSI